MADILSDLYPVPVTWVDGQQPTAQELNAWAGLIDTAFAILARLIGDFDGESSEQATYITNFVRAMGSLGWINPRLPRGLDQQGSITPTLVELLNPSLLSKEHLLLFPPKNYASISADFDADDTYGDDWTKVDQGTEDIPGTNLTAASQWTAWGRRILTSTSIPLNAKIKYVIDTDGATLNSQDYMGSYGPNSGANVAPSLYEIAEDGLDLCVYDTDEFDDSGEHWLTLPKILRCMNPYKPLHSAESIDFESVSIHWFSEETTPSYIVPNYIYDLADEDGRLPDGLVSLWVKTSSSIYRLVNQNSEEQIAFYVEADRTRIRLSLPDDFDLPHTADGQEALVTQYIVAFAGVSITEAVVYNSARHIIHRHDGTDDGSLVKAVSIANRFDPSQYTESPVSHNHFPQYLLRGGYTSGGDHLNRHNALLGPVLIAQEGATTSSTEEPSVEATTSHGLFFGSYVAGSPFISFYSPDTAEGNNEFDYLGKLTFWNKSVRYTDMIFLGAVLGGGWISAEDGTFKFGLEGEGTTYGALVQTGTFHTVDGYIGFRGGSYSARAATLFFDEDDIFKLYVDGSSATSKLELGYLDALEEVRAARLLPINGDHQFKYIGPEKVFAPAEETIDLIFLPGQPGGPAVVVNGDCYVTISSDTLGINDESTESLSVYSVRVRLMDDFSGERSLTISLHTVTPVVCNGLSPNVASWYLTDQFFSTEISDFGKENSVNEYGVVRLLDGDGGATYYRWANSALDPSGTDVTILGDGPNFPIAIDIRKGESLVVQISSSEVYLVMGVDVEYRRNY